jgi:CSLREA domain-containing protein
VFVSLLSIMVTMLGVFVGNTPQTVGVQPAVIITVNTYADELNQDGDCSLREAIQAANTDTAVYCCPSVLG